MTMGKEMAVAFNMTPGQREATEGLLRGFALKLVDRERAHSSGSQTFPVFKVTIHRDDGESSIAMPPEAPVIEQRFGALLRGLRP